MLPHEARIVGMMANPETMCKMLVKLEEENAALRARVKYLEGCLKRFFDEDDYERAYDIDWLRDMTSRRAGE